MPNVLFTVKLIYSSNRIPEPKLNNEGFEGDASLIGLYVWGDRYCRIANKLYDPGVPY